MGEGACRRLSIDDLSTLAVVWCLLVGKQEERWALQGLSTIAARLLGAEALEMGAQHDWFFQTALDAFSEESLVWGY